MAHNGFSTDMWRDGRLEIGTLSDALRKIIQAFQQSGKVSIASGQIGEGQQVLMVAGRTEDLASLLVKAVQCRQGIKEGSSR